ncbi:Hypothetical protein GLP15_3334 [Giardia lamblia P15]|uniref:ELMO domain-containing protein n=1 Tax=Giardia intestinalis (strain P15) TaxID=658858 RepID=E1EVT2_GIAIA|nr:Hypothetical protein GLP15_3334 [Giardia lamblia P15]
MLILWHRITVNLVFDIHHVKSSSGSFNCIYTYKKPNTILCSMFCTPAFDLLFVPCKTLEKKGCIKPSNILFTPTQDTNSDNDLFVEILQQSAKKSPTLYDYNNMFPLLLRSPLIVDISCVCLIEYHDFQTVSDEQRLSTAQYGSTGISILFKAKENSKKLRQIGLLFSTNIIQSTLFKQSIYPSVLSDSLTVSGGLISNSTSPELHISREANPSKLDTSTINCALDFSEIVEEMHAIMKNVHKRVLTFLATGLSVLQTKIDGYMDLRPLHISSNNTVHMSLLCGIGKILLAKNRYLNYLRSLDFQSTPGLIVKHWGLFEIIRRQIIDSCERTTTVDPFFWHMIGFQGVSPLTDFRASSLLALIALRIFADQYPDILFSESYGDYEDELDRVNHMLFICAKKMPEQIRESARSLSDKDDALAAMESLLNSPIGTSKLYSYPIALSLLDITHYIFTMEEIAQRIITITPFITLLILDFTVRYSEFVNAQITAALPNTNAGSNKSLENTLTAECLVTAKELETTPITEAIQGKADTYKVLIIDLFESKVQKFAMEALEVADPMKDTKTGTLNPRVRYGPWKKFHDNFWKYFSTSEHFMIPLTASVPAPIFDGIFRVIIGLSLLMHKRIQRLPIKQRYFQYTSVRTRLITDFKTVLLQSTNCPIYTIENFLMHISKLSSNVDQ